MIVDPDILQPKPLPVPGIKTSDQIVSEIHGAMANLPPEHQAALDHGISMMSGATPSGAPNSMASVGMPSAEPISASLASAQTPPTPSIPAYAKPGPYITGLAPEEEQKFNSWVQSNKIPFDSSPSSDYDMRGYWKAQQSGDANAATKDSAFDGRPHFPDTYKTPYHRTFSNESMYATPDAPHWDGDRLIGKDGKVVADESTPGGGIAPSSDPALPGMVNVTPNDIAANQPEIALPSGRSISGRMSTLESPKMIAPRMGSYEPLPSPPSAAATELKRLRDTGSGVSQIHNPFLKTLGTVADVVGSGFFPQFAQFVPGSTAHHEQLIAGKESQVGDEQKQRKLDEEAQKAADQSQTEESTRKHLDAQSEALIHPPGKVHDEEFFKDGTGAYIGYRDSTGRIFGPNDTDIPTSVKDVLTAGKPKPEKISTPFEKWLHDNPKGNALDFIRQEQEAKPKEGEMPLKNIDQMNKALESRYQVLHPGTPLPEHFKIPAGATQKDYDRIDKALEGTEKAFGTLTQQQTLNEMRKQTLALAQRKDERAALRDPNTEKEYKSVHDDLNKKFATTETQLQNIDQAQAEINTGAMGQAFGTIKSLVALAGGQGSGVRITQAELNSIANARGIAGGFEGWLNGLAGKGKLSGDQVNQLNSILAEVKKKGEEKRAHLGGTLDKLSGAKNTTEIRAIEKEYRDSGSQGGGSGKVEEWGRDASGKLVKK